MSRAPKLVPISMAPDPVIDAYKPGLDMTLLRENLKLSVQQRVDKMIGALRLVEELRKATKVAAK